MYPKNQTHHHHHRCNRCHKPADHCHCAPKPTQRVAVSVAEHICDGVYQKNQCAGVGERVYVSLVQNNVTHPEQGLYLEPPLWKGPMDGCSLIAHFTGSGTGGNDGNDGDKGPTGDKGEQGDQGLQGEQGEQGEQGPEGSEGSIGPRGIQGPQGEDGVRGEVGLRGPDGIQGPQGDKGVDGNEGAEGSAGPRGIQGAEGERGPRGDQGIQGDSFKIDATGDTGGRSNYNNEPDGFFYFDLEAGLLYGRVNGEWSAGIPFGIGPTGDRGDEGPRGPQGVNGQTGPQGLKGNEGQTGIQGQQGVEGPKGDKGDRGQTGSQGQQGLEGPRGTQGDRGPEGPQGRQGPFGPEGSRGPAGQRGDTGREGSQGEQGERGPAGGPPGPSGESFFEFFKRVVGSQDPDHPNDPIDEEDVQKWLQGPKGDKGDDLTNECDSAVVTSILCADDKGNITFNFSDGDVKFVSSYSYTPTHKAILAATVNTDRTWTTINPNGSVVLWEKKPRVGTIANNFQAEGIDHDGNQIISFDIISGETGGCLGQGTWLLVIECDNCNCIVPSHTMNANGSITVDDGYGLIYSFHPELQKPQTAVCPDPDPVVCMPREEDECKTTVPVLTALWRESKQGTPQGIVSYEGVLYYNHVAGNRVTPTKGTGEGSYSGGFDLASLTEFMVEQKLKELGVIA